MVTRRTSNDLARPIPTPYRMQIPIAYEDRNLIAMAALRAGTTMTNWCRETLVAVQPKRRTEVPR